MESKEREFAKRENRNRRIFAEEWLQRYVFTDLKHTSNPISRAVDFWLNSLVEGFVTEFTVDTLKAYNEAERYFFKGYCGK